MPSRATLLSAIIVASTTWSGGASAQHQYQAKGQTIGCATARAAAALSGSDPRRSDPNWVMFVMNDGHCVVITPASRWAVITFGTEMLMRNVVPGDGRQFYIPAVDLRELFPEAPPPVSTRAVSTKGQETFTVGRVGHANRTLKVEKRPDGTMKFDLDEWSEAGNNFSVSGVAVHVGSGWQYRDAMDSPESSARCGVNIDPRPDGGYNVSTVDGARCKASAGHNMVLYGSDTFPASSRTRH